MTLIGLSNYTIAGDVAVIATCIVMGILLVTSYVSRTQGFHIFMWIIIVLFSAAIADIIYHAVLTNSGKASFALLYSLRFLYYMLQFVMLFLFALYITVVANMEHLKARIVAVVSTVLLIGTLGTDLVQTLLGVGFRIDANGNVSQRTNIFMIGYILFLVILAVLMFWIRKRLYRRVIFGFYATIAVSLLLRFGQLFINDNSYTTLSYVFPVIAMLYIMHSTPYNVTLGAVDIRAMEETIQLLYKRGTSFVFLSLLFPGFNSEGKEMPLDVQSLIREHSIKNFRGFNLFQINNGQVILIAQKKRNTDYEARTQRMLDVFMEQYKNYNLPYKIVIGESIDAISQKNEYASLIQSIHRSIPENTVHRVCPEDIARFNRSEYILNELTDIYNKKDMDDPRVLAFCQPVYNIQTSQFDTAEALMRLRLDKTGLVYPDQFIPVAEREGFIHVLTEIILHKTCKEIHKLIEDGFRISRISVNVSVLELKEADFCGDINHIIDNNAIPGEKIAIELTESQSDADFMIMKEKIEELRQQGIRFYLDDFGTGYSNMERIMELPFDIIKFDRTMVIASGSDERSEKIVENLAHMFNDMNYSVLYEGVEDDMDEERCREMSASYLQGYKYSRPVPIEQLWKFLTKAG